MKKKMALGQRADVALRLLAKGKRVRHTRLDPFGYTKMRRIERGLIEHYRTLVDDALRVTTSDNLTAITELLGLIDVVRGYEDVKLRNVARYRSDVTSAATALGLRATFPREVDTQASDER
jgi:indolepyruvate ferredoxin oxidoreductase